MRLEGLVRWQEMRVLQRATLGIGGVISGEGRIGKKAMRVPMEAEK